MEVNPRIYRQIVHPWQAWIYWNLWLADGASDTGAIALLMVGS